MKLENLALNFPKSKSEEKVYQLSDLDYLTASPFYGSGDVQLGGGKCIPRFNSDKEEDGSFKPLFGTSSKLYLDGNSTPTLRYDPADSNHKEGHLHIKKGSALPNLTNEDAVEIFVEALYNKWMEEGREKFAESFRKKFSKK